MKAWVDNLKVGPWTVLTFTEKTLKYLDVDGKRVTYLNTESKLDFVLELGNCPILNLPKNEFPTYPSEKA